MLKIKISKYISKILFLSVIFTFLPSLICSQSNKPTIKSIKQEIIKNWHHALHLNEIDSDSTLIYCNRIDSLSNIYPEQFADYLIASNALAANCSYSDFFKNWNNYLQKGEFAINKYEKHLSQEMLLRSKVMLTYERCRFNDVQGKLEKALNCYEAVWYNLPNEHPDDILLSFRIVLPLSIALAYNEIGNFERALDWVKVAEKYLDKTHEIYPGYLYNLKGMINLMLNNYKEAEANCQKSIDWYLQSKKGKATRHIIKSYVDLSNVYLKQSDPQKAIKTLEEAKQQLLETPSKFPLQFQFAQIHLFNKEYLKVLDYGRKALVSANEKKEGSYLLKGQSLRTIGEALAGQEQWTSALDTIQLALSHFSSNFDAKEWEQQPDLTTSNTKLDLLKILVLKAEVLASYSTSQSNTSIKILQLSLSTYLHAIKLVKLLRAEYGDDDVKEYLSAQSFPIFEEALSVATQLYRITNTAEYLDYAFSFCEVSKALSLFENLRDIEAKEFSNLPDTLIDQERQLKIQIAQLELTLSNSAESERKTEIQDLLFSTKEKYKQLIELFKTDYPDYFNLKYDINTVSLTTLQESLSEEETVIEYFYGEKNIYVFTITKDTTTLRLQPLSPALEEAMVAFKKATAGRRGLTSKKKIKKFQDDSFFLYQQLIEPTLVDSQRLIIIPDGPLHQLAFAALTTDTLPTDNPNALAYLVKKCAIATNFSSSVFHHQRSKRAIQPMVSDSILIISPSEFPERGRLSLVPSEVATFFDGHVRIERQLTKEKVLPLLNAGYDNIFFFTHAAVGADNPFLQLYNDTIYLSELYATPIRSNLVLLGACETGLGEHQKGEGVLSLARGFAYQNVPNTVMTLWRVQDQAALWLSLTFLHYHVEEQLSPAEALARAQLDYLEEHKGAGRPFLWAGFVSSGN